MTKTTSIVLPIRCGAPAHAASAVIVLGVALAAAPTAALAAAQVRGSPEAVTIEAKDTSVEEVLKALSGAFDVHYRSSVNLQTRLTGNYEGSLQRVMKRVLDGYSYFVKIGDGRIDLTVMDAPRAAPSSGAPALVRVVAPPPDTAPVQPSPPVAPIDQPAPPASPAAPSAAASSSYASTERPPTNAPTPPSPPIAGVDSPAPPVSPAAPSSRKRDDLVAAGGKESRSLPPRRIKIASSSRHWKKGRHHARRTRLARSAIVCSRPVRPFGLPMVTPVSSFYWFQTEPVYLRSVSNCAPRRYVRVK